MIRRSVKTINQPPVYRTINLMILKSAAIQSKPSNSPKLIQAIYRDYVMRLIYQIMFVLDVNCQFNLYLPQDANISGSNNE